MACKAAGALSDYRGRAMQWMFFCGGESRGCPRVDRALDRDFSRISVDQRMVILASGERVIGKRAT